MAILVGNEQLLVYQFPRLQLGEIRWTYTLSTTADTTITALAANHLHGAYVTLLAARPPAGRNDLVNPVFKTVDITGDENVVLINSRPSLPATGSVVFHFRETDGKPAKIRLPSQIAGRQVKSIRQVNVRGENRRSGHKKYPLQPLRG